MSGYSVVVSGCDDSTEVEVELTDTEAATVRRIAGLVTEASEYGCQPVMRITPHGDGLPEFTPGGEG